MKQHGIDTGSLKRRGWRENVLSAMNADNSDHDCRDLVLTEGGIGYLRAQDTRAIAVVMIVGNTGIIGLQRQLLTG